MKREEIMEQVRSIFREVFDDESLLVTDETKADDIEDWDSLMHITLISEIEEHFGIKFKLKEVVGLPDVGATIDLIVKKMAEKN